LTTSLGRIRTENAEFLGEERALDADSSDGEPLHWAAVVQALEQGELQLLAIYLRQTNGNLDQAVAARLATMIDGPVSKTGWRLRVGRRPKLAPHGLGREQRFGRSRKDMLIASYITRHGAIDRSGFDAAVAAAAENFNLSPTTIKSAWKRYKHMVKNKELALRQLRSESRSI
jgi:hypothetical protein